MSDLGDRFSRRLLERIPEVVRYRVCELVFRHVRADPRAEGLDAHETFEHAQHRAPLFVGDRIEVFSGLVGVLNRGANRMRTAQRIQA